MRVGVVQRVLPSYRVPFFQRLGQRDIELTLYAGVDRSSSLPDAAPGDLALSRAPTYSWRSFVAQPAAVTAAWSRRHDVLVLPWEIRGALLLPALAAARARRLPVLLWGHGYSKRARLGSRPLRNAIGRLAAGTMFYSRPAAQRCVAEGFDARRVFVAPNALDQAPIQSARALWTPDRLAAFSAAEGLTPASEGGGVVLFSSRLEPDKGVDGLIEAFRRLDRASAHLVIIGDGSARAALERQASGLGDRVRFLGAIYEEPTLAGWFGVADLFAYPRAIGLSLLHASGYGLPTLTSDDTGSHNPEFAAFEPGVNGALYRHGDIADMATKIDALLEDPQRLAILSQGAEATARSWSIDAMVDGFVAACRAVADPPEH